MNPVAPANPLPEAGMRAKEGPRKTALIGLRIMGHQMLRHMVEHPGHLPVAQ